MLIAGWQFSGIQPTCHPTLILEEPWTGVGRWLLCWQAFPSSSLYGGVIHYPSHVETHLPMPLNQKAVFSNHPVHDLKQIHVAFHSHRKSSGPRTQRTGTAPQLQLGEGKATTHSGEPAVVSQVCVGGSGLGERRLLSLSMALLPPGEDESGKGD